MACLFNTESHRRHHRWVVSFVTEKDFSSFQTKVFRSRLTKAGWEKNLMSPMNFRIFSGYFYKFTKLTAVLQSFALTTGKYLLAFLTMTMFPWSFVSLVCLIVISLHRADGHLNSLVKSSLLSAAPEPVGTLEEINKRKFVYQAGRPYGRGKRFWPCDDRCQHDLDCVRFDDDKMTAGHCAFLTVGGCQRRFCRFSH